MFNTPNNNQPYQNDVPPNPKPNAYPGNFFKKLGGFGIGIDLCSISGAEFHLHH